MRIGILGGGQLARMVALAGRPLGFDFVFVDPAEDACAKGLGKHCISSWTGEHLLSDLSGCDRVTFDFENVPADSLALLDKHFIVRPSARALEVSQDRWVEKQLFQSLKLPIAPSKAVNARPELKEALDIVGYPAILKTRRLGYDGKGQYLIRHSEDLEPAWQTLGGKDLILEGWVGFSHECALTSVRSATGEVRFYPLTHTLHQEGILRFAIAPDPRNNPWQKEAEGMAQALLDELDYVGVMTVEMFVTAEGLLVNEFAPRVHNSAHWTIEGARCSQFENHLRAIADLPLGDTSPLGCALMINFIGQLGKQDMLGLSGMHWHDYGKSMRPGRKVGHATWVLDSFQSLQSEIEKLLPLLDRDQAEALTGWMSAAG